MLGYCFTGPYLFVTPGMNTARCKKIIGYNADYKIEGDKAYLYQRLVCVH